MMISESSIDAFAVHDRADTAGNQPTRRRLVAHNAVREFLTYDTSSN
jgi:hypothetical protein